MSHCDYIANGGLGSKNFIFNTKKKTNICINTTIYPTYIIFNNFEDTTELISYSGVSASGFMEEKYRSLLRFLPFYQEIQSPYGSFTIYNPVKARISFTLITLPGMCTNGIYFSTKLLDSVTFSKHMNGFNKLNIYDDKCVVFTGTGQKKITLKLLSDDYEDQLYVYFSFNNFTSISGNSSLQLEAGTSQPLIFRIVADDFSPPDWATINVETDGDEPRWSGSSFYVPKLEPPFCENVDSWYDEKTAIILIVILIILGILLIVLLAQKCICASEEQMLRSAAEGFSVSLRVPQSYISYTENEEMTFNSEFTSLQ